MIYLTKHSVPPVEELAESLRRAPGMRLGWLSWQDVWATASALAKTDLPAADLARLLAHKGLKHFDGFSSEPWKGQTNGSFWRQRWFIDRAAWEPPSGVVGFWRAGT